MSAIRFFFFFLSFPDIAVVGVTRGQDLAEALDFGGSDLEMDRGIVQLQEHSAQHRAKMWKVEGIMRQVYSLISENSFTYCKLLYCFIIMAMLIFKIEVTGFWPQLCMKLN